MTLPNNLISSDYFKVDSLGLSREVIILLANSDRFPIILLYSSCLIELTRTFSKMLNVCMHCHFSHVRLFVTLWTVACQAPLSMDFSRQEYWSGLPFPPPRALPNLVKSPISPVWQMGSLPYCHLGAPI